MISIELEIESDIIRLNIPRGGNALIFPYIRRLGSSFWVQNFEFQYLGGQKNEYFGGMKILWIFFGGSSQIWTIFRGKFYAF